MEKVALYYWAGARAAAGVESESVMATTVVQALQTVVESRADPRFSRVVKACSLLVDGVAAHPDDLGRVLSGPVRVDVLPPFAGGAPVRPASIDDQLRDVRPIVCTKNVSNVTGKDSTGTPGSST
jgi:molybdopterin converting factor small subunit